MILTVFKTLFPKLAPKKLRINREKCLQIKAYFYCFCVFDYFVFLKFSNIMTNFLCDPKIAIKI